MGDTPTNLRTPAFFYRTGTGSKTLLKNVNYKKQNQEIK